jgi:hypothetical protein
MRRLLPKPSPALIVAIVALVAATAGTATALPGTGSVTRNDIVTGAANKRVVSFRAVGRSELRTGTVTFNRLSRGMQNLLIAIASQTGTGVPGAQGAPGSPGSPGSTSSADEVFKLFTLTDSDTSSSPYLEVANVPPGGSLSIRLECSAAGAGTLQYRSGRDNSIMDHESAGAAPARETNFDTGDGNIVGGASDATEQINYVENDGTVVAGLVGIADATHLTEFVAPAGSDQCLVFGQVMAS